ncbi:hypothetical protein V2J09_019636 [Rumex salicifolius]
MASHRIDHGDLWKNKARILQLQLRERFRVAVDRRLGRPMFSDDGYFSSTVTRWLHRFRNFRRDSLASSSAFYRRRVNKDIFAEEDSSIIRLLQALAVPVLGNVCHVFMHGFNRVQVYGAEKLHQALLSRPKDKPLITVSNHVASIDDPFVIASLLPPHVLMDARDLRWTLCATDRCFKNPVTSAFFRSVKVLPVARGDGIHQKVGLDLAISKLNAGGWVHIFPEGSRSRDGGKTLGSAKRGVARLVLDSDNIPVVIPFVHTGMQEIMPIGAKFPRIGKAVTVLIGDPIQFDDLLSLEQKGLVSRKDLYDAISLRIGNKLQEMKAHVDKVAQEQALQLRSSSSCEPFPAAGILHQAEWELFGMDDHMTLQDSLSVEKDKPQEHFSATEPQQRALPERNYKAGYPYGGGIVSRIQGYKESMGLIGFAARDIFTHPREKRVYIKDVSPLRAWKQFLEANLLGPWNYGNVV